MKKTRIAAIAAATLLAAANMVLPSVSVYNTVSPTTVSAADETLTYSASGYELSYKIVNGSVEITGFRKTSSAATVDVVIPDKIKGKAVTAIGESAFNGCTARSIRMSDNIVSIKSWAFNNCKDLKTLKLSKNLSMEASGGYLFNGSESLSEFIVPDDMQDIDFISHLVYTQGGKKYIKTVVDAKVDEVYADMKTKGTDINWDIPSEDSKLREERKYHVAKYMFDHFDEYIDYDLSVPMNSSAYSLVKGVGACAGFTKSYLLLLMEAGFRSDEVEIISTYGHQIAGIKLYGQWYIADTTWNKIAQEFGMTYEDCGSYGYAELLNEYGYYLHEDTDIHVDAAAKEYVKGRYSAKYQRGDVNMDGILNMRDAVNVSLYLINADNETNLILADVNRDGSVDDKDVELIQKMLLRR